MSFISKFKVVAIQRQNVTFFGFRDPEDQEIRIVLPPSAEGIGLNPAFFRNLLNRPGMEDVKELVTLETFHPSQFELEGYHLDTPPNKNLVRPQKYSCLPVTEVEVILSKINLNKIKDTTIRENLAVFHRGINSLIRKYYNEGGVVNEEATPEQKKTFKQKYYESEERNEDLTIKIGEILEVVKGQSAQIKEQSSQIKEQSTVIKGLVTGMGLLQKEVGDLKSEVREERTNRVTAVMRENKERKAKKKAENLNSVYEDHMTAEGVSFSSVKKKANKEFDKNYDKM